MDRSHLRRPNTKSYTLDNFKGAGKKRKRNQSDWRHYSEAPPMSQPLSCGPNLRIHKQDDIQEARVSSQTDDKIRVAEESGRESIDDSLPALSPGSNEEIREGTTVTAATDLITPPSFSASSEQSFPLEPIYTIYVGKDRQKIPQSGFLRHVWGQGLNSACMVCEKDFGDDDPPIRTLSFETSQIFEPISSDVIQALVSPYPLRIFNRHYDCIRQRQIEYIPISHVWHQPVSEAQQQHIGSLKAANLVYDIPTQTLLALTKKLGSIEIWHDYFSVPQWNNMIHRQLLLSIPRIYSLPERMTIHWDDIEIKSLDFILQENTYQYQNFLDGISSVSKSRWFDRLWVTLEYIQGRDVLILCQNSQVFETGAEFLCDKADIGMGYFTKNKGQGIFCRDAEAVGHRYDRIISWMDMEIWKRMDPNYRTFGTAIFILAQKGCRDSHDYYFALRGLLGLGQSRDQVTNIIRGDDFESYHTIARQALEKGDYSPLLLVPPKNEKPDKRAPWLHGHSYRTEHLWDEGICHQNASSKTIIQDGKVCPELVAVGEIESFEYYDFRNKYSSQVTVFEHVSLKILDCSGTACPKAFCDAIDRIFVAHGKKGVDRSLYGSDMENYDIAAVGELLKQLSYLFLLDDSSAKGKRRISKVSEKVTRLLGLNNPQKGIGISRLEMAAAEAEWYQAPPRGHKHIEGLARVVCQYCDTRSLFRLSIWNPPKAEDITHVYRIPGLLYDLTVDDGVGIVVCNKRIIGKMAFGTPACECREVMRVEID